MKQRLIRTLVTAAVIAALPAQLLRAQQLSIAGKVIGRRGDAPIGGATIRIDGSNSGTLTDALGGFRLSVPEGEVTLRVTRIGFVPLTMVAQAGDERLEIRLDAKAIDLDAVVVTGQTGATEMRAIGNAVGRIDVADVVRKAPPAKLQDLLSTNVAGLRVMSTSGEVGVGGTTRIRGAGSLTLSNEPLTYVDGVRIDNSNTSNGAAYGRALGYFGTEVGHQWDVPSRINDLDPEQIESIEVIKGPAAAALYGTEAANGVIQVITKRGHVGRPSWDARFSAGANWLPDPERRWSSAWFIDDTGELQEFNLLRFNRERGYPAVFRTGQSAATGLSLSGGVDAIRYFASGDLNRDEGIVPFNWQNRFNGRGNLTYSHGRTEVNASYGMVRSRTRTAAGLFPFTAGIANACGAVDCRAVTSVPSRDTISRGWNGLRRPDAYMAVKAFDDIDRTIVGVSASQLLLPRLRHRVQLGADLGNNHSENLIPREDAGLLAVSRNGGYRAISTLRSSYYTAEYSAVAPWRLRPNLETEISGAGQYSEKTRHYVTALGQKFAVPGESDISGALVRLSSEDYIANKTLGLYVQERISLNDRVFLTAAIRGDDNSAFGANYDFVTYPKVSLSWVASEEPRLAGVKGPVETLKLRAAFGRAGQQPDAYAAVRQYRPVSGYQGLGGITPLETGNPDLKPEVSREVEMGFDAGFWNERASVELTYYDKVTRDVIIRAPLRPSSGFPGSKLINSGETENSGIELVVGVTPVTTTNTVLTVRGTIATNNSRVNRLMPGATNMYVGEFGRQYNVVGFAPYSYFYKRVVGSNILSELDPSKWQVECEGGDPYTRGNGMRVPCSQANLLYHGRPTPSWSGSLGVDLTVFRDIQLFGLVDFVGGNSILSGDVYFPHEVFYTSRRAAATKASMDSIRLNGTVAGAEDLAALADPRLAGIILRVQQGDDSVTGSSGVIRNGFARLRTLSVSYTLPRSVAARFRATQGSLALSGHNVAMVWREQKGSFGHNLVDPEIGQNNNQNGLALYQQERWPQSSRVSATLRLSF